MSQFEKHGDTESCRKGFGRIIIKRLREGEKPRRYRKQKINKENLILSRVKVHFKAAVIKGVS